MMQGPSPQADRSRNMTQATSFRDDELPEQKMSIQSDDWKAMGRMERGRTFEEADDRIGFIRKVFGILSA